jgi:hypothetical protein
MAFATGYLADPVLTGAGETYGNNHVILAREEFEDGLKVGRFSKFDNDQIENMDGSATPVIAGVVKRSIVNPVEDAATRDSDIWEYVNIVSQGLCTVSAKAGETPTFLDKVYASNEGDANDGLAMVDSNGIDTNAVFVEEIKSGVWLINANPQPGAFVASQALADPGDAGAITVNRNSTVAIVTAGAETRTLPNPAKAGLTVALTLSVDNGDCVITAAAAINQTGNTTLTFDNAGETIILTSVTVGANTRWRVVSNDGVGLTTP